jgi:hypothetical protein
MLVMRLAGADKRPFSRTGKRRPRRIWPRNKTLIQNETLSLLHGFAIGCLLRPCPESRCAQHTECISRTKQRFRLRPNGIPSPGRIGDSRSRPQAAKRWRGRARLEALTAVRHLAGGQQGLSAQPTSSSERPVDPTVRHGDAGDMAADMLFERGAPGHEAESQAIVDHGEPAT